VVVSVGGGLAVALSVPLSTTTVTLLAVSFVAPAPVPVVAAAPGRGSVALAGGSRTVSTTWIVELPAMMSGTSTVALLLSPTKVRFVPLMSTVRLAPGRAVVTLALGVSMLLLMAPDGMTWYARMVVSMLCSAK
jgi:hypothetical protein